MTTILSPQFFAPVRSLKLGRFVTSVDHPHQEYHDPAYAHPPLAPVNTSANYSGITLKTRSSGFTIALTSLMSTGFSKRANTRVRIKADRVQIYTLENSSEWFREATSRAETQRSAERAIDQGDDLYFVVSFTTITDARIVHESIQAKEHTGQAGLPVGLSLNAAGVVAPLGNLIDPQVGGQRGSEDGVAEQFLVPGEQICAVQYRKVCHRWLSSKDIGQATLAKVPRWSAGDRWRDKEEGVDDILEVDMEDVGQPEGEWVQLVRDSEVLLLRSLYNCRRYETILSARYIASSILVLQYLYLILHVVALDCLICPYPHSVRASQKLWVKRQLVAFYPLFDIPCPTPGYSSLHTAAHKEAGILFLMDLFQIEPIFKSDVTCFLIFSLECLVHHSRLLPFAVCLDRHV